MKDIILLIIGMILLIKGADWFVSGSSKIAKALKIPSLVIGLTLVSMGTSAPELSVSLIASIQGNNELSFGNVIGSNIFNTLFILGVSSLFIPLILNKEMKKYDIPIMLFLYVLLLIFGFIITPYKLDIVESIIFVLLFIAYIVFLFIRSKKNYKEIEEEKEEKITKKVIIKSIIYIVIGLSSIIFGGDLVVDSASSLASKLGMSQSLIGLTIVAIGTSLPELVTSIVASIKKENDIAIGNVIGSNIFNIVFILGVSSVISPLSILSGSLIDVIVLIITGILVLLISLFSKNIKKWHGIIFVILYIIYVVYLILNNYGII